MLCDFIILKLLKFLLIVSLNLGFLSKVGWVTGQYVSRGDEWTRVHSGTATACDGIAKARPKATLVAELMAVAEAMVAVVAVGPGERKLHMDAQRLVRRGMAIQACLQDLFK